MSLGAVRDRASELTPGILIGLTVALAAQFLAEQYGAPALLLALLIGLAISFVSEHPRSAPGLEFSATTVLRAGIMLLGARMSADVFAQLNLADVAIVLSAVLATIGFGVVAARALGRGWRLGALTGGSVAICGVSAALAIAAVLPKNQHSDRNLSFTAIGVTVLSTISMIVYPMIAGILGFDGVLAGIFLGATIHDVAQVVGAGYSHSEQAGDVATVVKLIRVLMLAPVVVALALIIRLTIGRAADNRPPLVPLFVLGFVLLAAASSLGVLPPFVVDIADKAAGWALLISIASVGMRTSLSRLQTIGGQAVTLILAETTFLATIVAAGLYIRYG